MKIGLDLDGVLYDWNGYVRGWVEPFLKCNVDYKKYDHVEGMSESDKETYIRYFCENITQYLRKYIYERDLLPKMLKSVQDNGHEIFVITARGKGDTYFKYVPCGIECMTKMDMKLLGVKEENVIFTEDKAKVCKELGIDVMIDDYFENYVSLTENGVKTYLMEQEHNVDYEAKLRVKSLSEFFKEVGVM